MKETKTCKCCGKIYETIPATAELFSTGDQLNGYYFNCSCKSTLFWPMVSNSKKDLKEEKVL